MITLTNGNIQTAAGVTVPGGFIELVLQQDCMVIATPGQVMSAIPIRFNFDSTAKLSGTCKIYSNAELTPSTGYTVNLFDSDGGRINQEPVTWIFNQAANSVVDIGTMANSGPHGPAFANPFILLQTNSVNNGNQNKLNLLAAGGSGLVWTDAGNGNITVSLVRVDQLSINIDGGGGTPTLGKHIRVSVPMNCTVTGWVLVADASGSAVIDVLRSTFTGFPTTASIAGTDKPTLATAQKAQNLGPLTNWTSTSISAGDVLEFNLSSVTTCTVLSLTLNITVP